MRFNDWIAVAVLACEIYFYRDARHALDHEFAGKTRVPAGSAGGDVDLAQLLNLRVADARSRQRNMTGAVDARLDRLPHRLRLLIDLLQHVVRKAVLVGLWYLIDHEVSILTNDKGLLLRHLPTYHRVH